MWKRTPSRLLLGLSLAGISGCVPDVAPSSNLPSCHGLPTTCGPKEDENCCASPLVAGGSFDRIDVNMEHHPSTVSTFQLDRFEVTVGRFRNFVDGYPDNMPQEGAGAHPKIADSGWQSAWNPSLPADQATLKAKVAQCAGATWSDVPVGSAEQRPVNCVSWYVAFAFCAWDGGFLPTEAEWTYAAAGGKETRPYPWGSQEPDPTYAVYCTNYSAQAQSCLDGPNIPAAGSRSTKGDGKFGQADLAGSLREWNLDYQAPYTDPCNDCATLNDATRGREGRGGDWNNDKSQIGTSFRIGYNPEEYDAWIGIRCARRP